MQNILSMKMVMAGMREKIFSLLLAFIIIALFSACGHSMSGIAYDTLYVGAVAYDTALSYAGDEYRAGRLSEEQKAQIIEYAEGLQLAMRAAQDALSVYRRAELIGEDLSDQEKTLTIALDVVETAQGMLTEYVQSLNKKGDT